MLPEFLFYFDYARPSIVTFSAAATSRLIRTLVLLPLPLLFSIPQKYALPCRQGSFQHLTTNPGMWAAPPTWLLVILRRLKYAVPLSSSTRPTWQATTKSNTFPAVGRLGIGIERPRGKCDSVKPAGFMQPSVSHHQCTRTTEHVYTTAERENTHHPPQSTVPDPFSKPIGFAFFKERCLVILSSFPVASKMSSRAA